MQRNRKKIKLKNPANLISAIMVLVGSIILSIIIRQNFFLVFLSAFLLYVGSYVFLEKRRLRQNAFHEESFPEEEENQDRGFTRAAKQQNSFEVVKSAKFNDVVAKEKEMEQQIETEEEDSWRSMYNQLSDSAEDSSFEEDYKKYFSTSLPDKEEISKAQQTQTGNKQYYDVNSQEDSKFSPRKEENYGADTVSTVETTSTSMEEDSSEDSEEEEGHILDSDDIESETVEIQNQVNDLIANKQPEDAVLAKSITAKLKFFRKTRKKPEIVEEDYDQDEVMSSNLQLIDALYNTTEPTELMKREDPLESEDVEEVTEETELLKMEEDFDSELKKKDNVGDILLSTLKQADIDASIKAVTNGASFIRYDIRPRSMSKLNRIVKLETMLEKALNVGPIRVVDVGTNHSLAGIEIPNPERRLVSFQSAVESNIFQTNRSSTSFILGNDVYGEPVLADLKNLPHLLIVGQDAKEINMCFHSLVCSILSKVGVFHVDFLMIDISNREFNVYDSVPHMYSPVLNFADDALSELEALEKIIDTRLDLFQRSNTRDIVSYNATKSESPLSRIIVFINELADLMGFDAKRTEPLVCSILQKARSAGIHVVLGTSQPSEDILTGLIKANITSKICFAVESAEASQEILGMTGAEKLLGNGDMLYYPKGYLTPKRLQGTKLEKEEIQNLVSLIL